MRKNEGVKGVECERQSRESWDGQNATIDYKQGKAVVSNSEFSGICDWKDGSFRDYEGEELKTREDAEVTMLILHSRCLSWCLQTFSSPVFVAGKRLELET